MSFDYASKIQGLIAKAESAQELGNNAEAAAYRSKAEQMMQQYRIAEEDLIATDQFASVPIMETIDIMESSAYENPLRNYYWDLFSRIAQHAGVRINGKYTGWGIDSKLTAEMVGYAGDIAYAKFIWTSARLVFFTRIDVCVNPSLSDQENCYFMRNSGMKRNEVAYLLWGSARNDGVAHGKVQRLYLAECDKRGETPRVSGRGIQVDVYREAYAREFSAEFAYRLRAAKDAAGSSGGGLELHGRKERVDEAFYQKFPHRRPMGDEERKRMEQEAEEAEANCPDCAKTTSKTGKCKAHRPTSVSAAEQRAYNRKYYSPEAQAGARAGEQAAQQVELARGFKRQERAEGSSRSAIQG